MSEPTLQHVIDIDARFWIERQGRRFVLYAGLLDAAHRQGLKAIRTKLLQVPDESNGHMAICYAEVETERGVFSGIGDAQPENVNRLMVHCLVRMAETRAKARALRDAINVGVAAVEELDDEALEHEPTPTSGPPRPASNGAPQQAPRAAQTAAQAPRPSAGPQAGTGLATPAQVRAMYNLARGKHKMSEEQLDSYCQNRFGRPPAELTKAEASTLITELQGGDQAQS